jgi:hypothetical protein
MRYLVARPLPDELLGSVWIRTVRRAGLPVRAVARAVTGRKWAPGFFQVAHLTNLAPLLEMEPMALLWKHTVFPYATAFFGRPVYDAALGAALSTGTGAIGMGAVTQSASDPVRFRRFCAACARDEVRLWGESYWHRAHNLPGVLTCDRHGTVLRETELRTAGPKNWDVQLPHEVAGDRMLHQPLSSFDRELARRSLALLNRGIGEQLLRDATWYRTELLNRGLLTPTRQVNFEKLARWLQSQMGTRGQRYGLGERDLPLGWLALMVRPRSGHPFIPLKHLIFETALALQTNPASTLLDHVPSGPSGRSTVELDRQYAVAVKKVVAGYVTRRERVRIQDALTEAGCWSAFRHSRSTFPRVAEAVVRLRSSGVSLRPLRSRYRT